MNRLSGSEADGFAHSYQITHGTSVCALALRVPDAQAAITRAKAMLDVPHAGAIGPGELDIPAVRGLGGSLDVATNLTALVIGLVTAYAGARFAYQRTPARDI